MIPNEYPTTNKIIIGAGVQRTQEFHRRENMPLHTIYWMDNIVRWTLIETIIENKNLLRFWKSLEIRSVRNPHTKSELPSRSYLRTETDWTGPGPRIQILGSSSSPWIPSKSPNLEFGVRTSNGLGGAWIPTFCHNIFFSLMFGLKNLLNW